MKETILSKDELLREVLKNIDPRLVKASGYAGGVYGGYLNYNQVGPDSGIGNDFTYIDGYGNVIDYSQNDDGSWSGTFPNDANVIGQAPSWMDPSQYGSDPINESYWYADYNGGGGGGGNSSPDYMTIGHQYADFIADSIQNGTAVWCTDAQETGLFKVAQATSITASEPSLVSDVLGIFHSNTGVVETLGRSAGVVGAVLNTCTTIIGVESGTNGVKSDGFAIASMVFGDIGAPLAFTPLCEVGLVLDGLSLLCSIVSMANADPVPPQSPY